MIDKKRGTRSQAPAGTPDVGAEGENVTDLGRRATRGALVTLGGQGVRITVQLLGVVLLARLLSPADFGVTAMVLAVIGIAEIIRDFGLTSAAVQARTLTVGQRTNLLWINTGIGASLTVIVCALAPLIALFYRDERLVAVTLVLSLTFVLEGFAAQFRASLNRSFRFAPLTGIEVGAQAIALGVALWLAATGFGYWAIVVQQVLQVLLQAAVLPVVARWWPGFPRRGEEMRPLLNFGGGLVAGQLLVYLSRNVDSMVIGRAFGATALGYYNRAFQLMLLPLNQIIAPSTRVALPTLSRLNDRPDRYAEFVVFGQTVLLNVVGFVLGICAAQAHEIIPIVLGDQWLASIPLFQVLSIAGFFQAAAIATYWIFLSKALTRRYFWYTVWTRPAMVVCIVLGAFWGVKGVAVAYMVTTALLWPIGVLWLRGHTDAPLGRLMLASLRTLAVYAIAAVAAYLATAPIAAIARPIQLIVGIGVYVAALAFIALVYSPYRRDLASIIAARRLVRSAPKA